MSHDYDKDEKSPVVYKNIAIVFNLKTFHKFMERILSGQTIGTAYLSGNQCIIESSVRQLVMTTHVQEATIKYGCDNTVTISWTNVPFTEYPYLDMIDDYPASIIENILKTEFDNDYRYSSVYACLNNHNTLVQHGTLDTVYQHIFMELSLRV